MKKYLSITVIIIGLLLSFSVILVMSIQANHSDPITISDRVGDAEIYIQAEHSRVAYYQCIDFEWQLDYIQEVYVDNRGVVGYATQAICSLPRVVKFRVVIDEETEKFYTFEIKNIYQNVHINGILIGFGLIIGGIALLFFEKVVSVDFGQKKWLVAATILLPVIGLLVRSVAMNQLEYSFYYESLLWLKRYALPANRFACEYLSPFCSGDAEILTFQEIFAHSFHTRTGLPLPLTGIWTSFLPMVVNSAAYPDIPVSSAVQMIHFFLDVFIALMMMAILWRLKFPDWVSLFGGYLFILFIPFIIDSATVMREPVSRFSLILTLCAYIFAVSAKKSWQIIIWVILASCGIIILGFASTPNRLVMWLMFATFIVVSLFSKANRLFAIGTQIAIMIGIVAFLYPYSQFVSQEIDPNLTPEQVHSLGMTGILPDGEIHGLTTVTTCELIWCRFGEKFWTHLTISESIQAEPILFAKRYIYSLYGNVSTMSNVYRQDFLLTIPQQYIQQYIVALMGTLGIAWLLGHWHTYWKSLILVGIPTAYFITIFSLNGIETRRVIGVIQIFVLATPIYLFALSNIFHQDRKVFWWIILISLAALLTWLVSLDWLAWLVPAHTAYLMLQILRVVTAIIFILLHLFSWAKQDEAFNLWTSTLILAFALLAVTFGDLNEHDEYEWSTPLHGTIQQTITEVETDTNQWLIVDLASPAEAAALEIRVNGVLLKPENDPMTTYMTRDFVAYTHAQTFNYEPFEVWYAYPLSSEFLQEHVTSGTVNIEIKAAEPVEIFGNHLINNHRYIGPYTDVESAYSFAYLLYKSDEARVNMELDVSNITSQWFSDTGVQSGDLGSAFGYQSGIYRIFVVPETDTVLPTN